MDRAGQGRSQVRDAERPPGGPADTDRPHRHALRASDADRQRVADRLVQAHGEGRLTLAEFDERVRDAYAAVRHADLEPLLADLPGAAPRPAAIRTGPIRTGPIRTGPIRTGPIRTGPIRTGPIRPVPFPVPGLPLAGPRRGDLRVAVAAWAAVSVVNLVIWVAVVAGHGAPVYPWWVWVAGPWGVALLARAGVRRVVPPPGPFPASGR